MPVESWLRERCVKPDLWDPRPLLQSSEWDMSLLFSPRPHHECNFSKYTANRASRSHTHLSKNTMNNMTLPLAWDWMFALSQNRYCYG